MQQFENKSYADDKVDSLFRYNNSMRIGGSSLFDSCPGPESRSNIKLVNFHTLLRKQLVKTKSLQAPYPCIFKTNGMDLNFPLTHFLTYFSTNAFSENAPMPQASER